MCLYRVITLLEVLKTGLFDAPGFNNDTLHQAQKIPLTANKRDFT